ncbi:sialin isoform X2 [Cephus cinctus]|uniref:Sialin isoform X2 n=1 Tax=Cephus cinctus TaxID=211228 RepID=A0AAJ7VXK0_CEPCN|nr:sialin isoform X2 [Cephus cinctus]
MFWKLLQWIPTRVVICVMLFINCWTSYMLRLQMPILAVPMIISQSENSTSGACVQDDDSSNRKRRFLDDDNYLYTWITNEKDSIHLKRLSRASDNKALEIEPRAYLFSGEPFDWSPEVRGQLIAAYSYGNVPGNFIGGIMALKLGPKRAVLWTALLAALISLITPLLAHAHWGVLLMSRVIIGFTGGVTFPACHTMVAKWAPPDEKQRFIWSLLGGTFGTMLTYPMIAGIAGDINWEMGWYLPSLLMFVWIGFWALLAYDTPNEHPGISTKEKEYILNSQMGIVRQEKPTLKQTPVKQIFTSIPFWSLIMCHFGNLFLLFFYQNAMMLYLTKALGFKLAKGGAIASLPWAGRMLFGFFFSWAGDTIKKRKLISITALRKGATIFSHLIPGICLIAVGYLGCSFVWANFFLVLALGFNGAASISNLSNNQDLSPNFAGFLYGIMNTIGCTTGMIIPPMVEAIAGRYGNPINKWQILFWIGAAVCILCMLIFILGGSGQVQSWNEIAPAKRTDTEVEAGAETTTPTGTKVQPSDIKT